LSFVTGSVKACAVSCSPSPEDVVPDGDPPDRKRRITTNTIRVILLRRRRRIKDLDRGVRVKFMMIVEGQGSQGLSEEYLETSGSNQP
jgi:hypothetical protein